MFFMKFKNSNFLFLLFFVSNEVTFFHFLVKLRKNLIYNLILGLITHSFVYHLKVSYFIKIFKKTYNING